MGSQSFWSPSTFLFLLTFFYLEFYRFFLSWILQAAKEFETELKKDPEASSVVSSEEKPTANNEGEKQELEVSGTKESL